MTVRHVLLTAAALAVLGLAIYLFLEVNAPPATAQVGPRRPAAAEVAPDEDPPVESDPAAAPVAAPRGRPARDGATGMRDATAGDRAAAARPAIAEDAAPASTGADVQQLDAIMSEANKAYDRGDYEEAKAFAARVLTKEPTSVRMLRIMVSSSCIDGDTADAQRHYLLLPARDREQMQVRCARYGVTFTEPP